MPDATGGIASGLYWIATGKLPIDDLKNDDNDDDPKAKEPKDDPLWRKDAKAKANGNI